MRSALIRGELPTPSSMEAACGRRDQLVYEIERTRAQVDDPTRRERFATVREYAAWRGRATSAVSYMSRELSLLEKWIAAHAPSPEAAASGRLAADDHGRGAEVAALRAFWSEP